MPPIDNENKDDDLNRGGGEGGQGNEQSGQPGAAVPGANAGDEGATGDTPSGQEPGVESGKEGGDDKGKEGAPKSALEAVLKVVGDKRQAAEKEAAGDDAGKAGAGKDGKQGGEGEEGKDEDLTVGKIDEAEWKALPQRTRQRITQFRAKLKERDTTIQAMTPKVQTYDQLVSYCRTSGLSPDDFTEGLEIMRLVKQDPAAAWERLQPILTQLRQHVGEELPDDLRTELEEGMITEARAKELARARKEQERLEAQNRQRTAADQERQQEQLARNYAKKVEDAVRSWEQGWRTSDPDYKRKAPRVWERMQVLLQGERELTPERAVEIAQQARQDVEDWLKELMPPKQGKQPVPQGGSGNTKKQPSSALEAAKLALENTRAAA